MNTTTQGGSVIDADDAALEILSKIRKLKAFPDIVVTIDQIVNSLLGRFTVRFYDLPDFTRRYGRRVRAVGGSYSECRGSTQYRNVEMPGTPEAFALADELLAELVKIEGAKLSERTVLIADGPMPHSNCGRVESWVTVQYRIRPIAAFRDAVRSGVMRSRVCLSWPDPRSQS